MSDFDLGPKLKCPLSGKYMIDPVLANDGYTYEKNELLEYFKYSNISPVTKDAMSYSIRENFSIKEIIDLALKCFPNEKEYLYNIDLIPENIKIDQNFIEESSNFLLKRVLSKSKYINDIDSDEWCVMHLICAFSNYEVIDFFFENIDHNINLITNKNENVLHLLFDNDNLTKNDTLFKLLDKWIIKFLPFINEVDNKDNKPIHNLALYTNDKRTINLLKENDAIFDDRFYKNIKTNDILKDEFNEKPNETIDLLNCNDPPSKPIKKKKKKESKKRNFVEKEFIIYDDDKLKEELGKCKSNTMLEYLKDNFVELNQASKEKYDKSNLSKRKRKELIKPVYDLIQKRKKERK
jgi:hypothetical protein